MGFLDSLFESDQESETRSTFEPWGPAAPGLASIANLLTSAAGRPLSYFPDQTYAGQTEAERQAIEGLKTAAGAYPGVVGDYLGPAGEAFQYGLGAPQTVMGMGLQDVASNPYLAAVSERMGGDISRNLAENIMPQLKLNESLYGSQEIGRGIAARGASEAYADALADLYGGAWQAGLGAETARYGAGLGAQASALGQTPMLAGLGYEALTQPSALLGEAGARERAEEQRAIDEAMGRFEFEQMEPYTRAGYALPGLMQLGTGFGTQTETLKGTSTLSPFQQLGGLMMGGGMLAGGLGGMGFLGGSGGVPARIGAQPWGGGYTPGGFPMIG